MLVEQVLLQFLAEPSVIYCVRLNPVLKRKIGMDQVRRLRTLERTEKRDAPYWSRWIAHLVVEENFVTKHLFFAIQRWHT